MVIAEGTRKLLGNLFELEDLGAKDLKGITGPVRAWSAVRESAVDSRFEALRTATTPLIGREAEIELLMDRWAQAKAGEGRVLLISGEPGIGKWGVARRSRTALCRATCSSALFLLTPSSGQCALSVDCSLERAAGFDRDDVPETKLAKLEILLGSTNNRPEEIGLIAELLSLPTAERYSPPRLSPQKRKEETLEALLAQVTALAERKPMYLLFEDVHWIDPSSLEWLSLAVRRASADKMLLVVTARPEFTMPWANEAHVETLALTRLGRREGTVLAQNVAGNKALPDELVNQIVSRTDGIPLFLEELTRTVLESGLLREERDGFVLTGPLQPLAIPTTLHASLLARLDRLAPVRTLAQVGAALGRQFSHDLIAAVVSLPNTQLLDALNQLVASEFSSGAARRPMQSTHSSTLWCRMPRTALCSEASAGSFMVVLLRQFSANFPTSSRVNPRFLPGIAPRRDYQRLRSAGGVEQANWRCAAPLSLRR